MLNNITGIIKMSITERRGLAPYAPYLILLLAAIIVFFVVLRFPPARVGDGSEYYGLFFAWKVSLKPWMTESAYDAYQALYIKKEIFGFVPTEELKSSFPALRIGQTSDFNHFWFYSLAAFITSKIFNFVGIKLNAHQSFMALHCVLLLIPLISAWAYRKHIGLAASFIILFISPALWYVNKVHTEMFTVSLVLTGIIFLTEKKYIFTAFCMALASTQNPSFSLLAGIFLGYGLWNEKNNLPKTYIETAFTHVLIGGIFVLVLIHPAYYFARYGVITPQLLAGGVSFGDNLKYFYIWILDPDVGLLPGWPIGMAIGIVAIILVAVKKYRMTLRNFPHWLPFILLYTAINMYVHSSTTNLNSGATLGVARYSLWYLPVFYPFFIKLPVHSIKSMKIKAAAVVALLSFFIYNAKTYNPKKYESYTKPSGISRFIQTNFSVLYNPPYEIFLERYSGLGESPAAMQVKAVLGPDCRKLLAHSSKKRTHISNMSECRYDLEKLRRIIKEKEKWTGWSYIRLNKKEREEARLP